MSEFGTFRKRPVEIRAIRFDGDNAGDCLIFCDDADAWIGRANLYGGPNGTEQVKVIVIVTHEGNMSAFPGDWIIREPFATPDRQFYPCKPDIFERVYERTTPDTPYGECGCGHAKDAHGCPVGH